MIILIMALESEQYSFKFTSAPHAVCLHVCLETRADIYLYLRKTSSVENVIIENTTSMKTMIALTLSEISVSYWQNSPFQPHLGCPNGN